MKLEKANKKDTKLRIGISGASGFGKTYSALLMAKGIAGNWEKVAIIDTENGSASLYAGLGTFNTLTLQSPFSPERYIEAIKTCEEAGMEVIIIDSVSHEWVGEGGCLDILDSLGGRFHHWAKVTPRHRNFIQSILASSCHVIATTRRKVDYSIENDANQKTKVVKHGTKEITREGFEYEMTLSFQLLNDNNLAKVSKDRTGLFNNQSEFRIGESTGKKLLDWCLNGSLLLEAKKEILECTSVEGLRYLYQKHGRLGKEIYNLIVERKRQLENLGGQIADNKEIIKRTKVSKYGTENGEKSSQGM